VPTTTSGRVVWTAAIQLRQTRVRFPISESAAPGQSTSWCTTNSLSTCRSRRSPNRIRWFRHSSRIAHEPFRVGVGVRRLDGRQGDAHSCSLEQTPDCGRPLAVSVTDQDAMARQEPIDGVGEPPRCLGHERRIRIPRRAHGRRGSSTRPGSDCILSGRPRRSNRAERNVDAARAECRPATGG
jgi:hypothetical protein